MCSVYGYQVGRTVHCESPAQRFGPSCLTRAAGLLSGAFAFPTSRLDGPESGTHTLVGCRHDVMRQNSVTFSLAITALQYFDVAISYFLGKHFYVWV